MKIKHMGLFIVSANTPADQKPDVFDTLLIMGLGNAGKPGLRKLHTIRYPKSPKPQYLADAIKVAKQLIEEKSGFPKRPSQETIIDL